MTDQASIAAGVAGRLSPRTSVTCSERLRHVGRIGKTVGERITQHGLAAVVSRHDHKAAALAFKDVESRIGRRLGQRRQLDFAKHGPARAAGAVVLEKAAGHFVGPRPLHLLRP